MNRRGIHDGGDVFPPTEEPDAAGEISGVGARDQRLAIAVKERMHPPAQVADDVQGRGAATLVQQRDRFEQHADALFRNQLTDIDHVGRRRGLRHGDRRPRRGHVVDPFDLRARYAVLRELRLRVL